MKFLDYHKLLIKGITSRFVRVTISLIISLILLVVGVAFIDYKFLIYEHKSYLSNDISKLEMLALTGYSAFWAIYPLGYFTIAKHIKNYDMD